MAIKISKPYLISWLAIPVLSLIGLLFRQHTLDIQLYDTYYVIGNTHVVLAGSVLLLVIGIGYWLIKWQSKTPNSLLVVLHLVLTISVLILCVLPAFGGDNLVPSDWLVWLLFTFVLAQFIYLINIVATWMRG
jgi:heme/copper-type cytochrome/quinol oxidase subunit 1